ncbi:MAG: protein phosphatase 2C domain-containing protein [Polyangiaceae bacterium]|nr:protein phosphatase 2C domain-containing protein [Polyangiaceae bacterium]
MPVPTTPDSPHAHGAGGGLRLEYGQTSDPGRDPAKQVNEDSCGYAETKFGHLFVICDGMGGHVGGKEASTIAIRTIFETVAATPSGTPPPAALRAAIEEAARRVYHFGGAGQHLQRPGSTCVAVLIHEGGLEAAHVGDSRAYAIRSGEIYRLTRDHSMVQNLVDSGVLTEAESIGHPDANKITRALGMTPSVDVDVRPEPMELFEGDVILLASDGLTDMVRNEEILATTLGALPAGGIQHACDRLVAVANDHGGHDNVTVQLVRVLEAAQKNVAPTMADQPLALPPGPEAARPKPTTVETPAFRVSSTVTDEAHDVPPLALRPLEAPPGPGGARAASAAGVALAAGPQPGPVPAAPAGVPGNLSTTTPDGPGPTIIDAHGSGALGATPLAGPVGHAHRYAPIPPPAWSGAHEPPRRLLYLVLGMASAIGILLALLIWALWYR